MKYYNKYTYKLFFFVKTIKSCIVNSVNRHQPKNVYLWALKEEIKSDSFRRLLHFVKVNAFAAKDLLNATCCHVIKIMNKSVYSKSSCLFKLHEVTYNFSSIYGKNLFSKVNGMYTK